MGYYIETTGSDVFIPKSKHKAAYKALCELNQHDELKRGGSHGATDKVNYGDPRPAGMDYHPARWFSWMDANYPAKCKDLQDVLREARIDWSEDAKGNIISLHFDCKAGNEELFFEALAPFVKKGGYVNWRGESGELFRFEYDGKSMTILEGSVVWQ